MRLANLHRVPATRKLAKFSNQAIADLVVLGSDLSTLSCRCSCYHLQMQTEILLCGEM